MSQRQSALSMLLPLAATLSLACMLPSTSARAQQQDNNSEYETSRDDGSQTARRERRKREMQQASAESAQQGQADAAQSRYPQAARQEPEARATRKYSPKIDQLSAAYEAKDAAAAAAHADELIADPDTNAYEKSISARIAGELLLAQDATRGRAYLEQAVAFDGLSNDDHFDTMRVLAQQAVQGADKAAGLSQVERYLAESGSTSNEDMVLKGVALYQAGRYDDAIAPLKQAVDAAGAQARPEWKQALMAAYAGAGRAEEAAAMADQAASQTAGDPGAQLTLAGTYIQSKQYAKAAEIYERLRAAGQLTEERDYRNLVNIYRNDDAGKEKEIVSVINDGLQKGVIKEDHAILVSLAEAYYFSEQEGPAIDAYRKAAPLAPSGETYLNLARVYLNAGRRDEARQAAQQALDKGLDAPDDARRIIERAGG